MTNNSGALPIEGGTLTGPLVLSGDPVTALGAATKQYVDAIAAGIDIKESCYAGTTGNLAGYTYNNGASGVGATLTAGANGAFATDGVSPALNARILVKSQTAPAQNGIYTLTQVGNGGAPAILTRAADYNTVAEINPGNLVIIEAGTTLAVTSWLQTATVVTIGTDAITFVQFSGSAAAPTTATYLLQTANGSLPNAQAMGALATGIVKNTTATGVQSIAVKNIDYYGPSNGAAIPVTDGGIGVQTLTTPYGVLCAGTTATNPVQTLASLGAAGTVLTSNGAGALPSFQAASSSGALVYLAGATAATSASIAFTSNIDSTYDSYLIVVSGITVTTDNVELWWRMSTDGGATWKSGASDYTYSFGSWGSAGGGSAAAAQIKIFNTSYPMGNDAGNSYSGIHQLALPASNSLWKRISGTGGYMDGATNYENVNEQSGIYKSTTAVNGLQLSPSSGNLGVGTMRLYGIKNS